MNRWRTVVHALVAVAGLAIFSACGGDSDSPSQPATGSGTTAPTAAAEEETDDLIKDKTPADFFAANCATCHGANREGGVGLPLTPEALTQDDAFYADVIKNGRPGTGMTMMGTILGMSDEEIETLVRYLKTDQP